MKFEESYLIENIKPYKKNPRKNDESVKYVQESIKQFGFKQPIVITPDGTLVVGHTRVKAAKNLGFTHIPAIIADDLDEVRANAYRLADNKVAEFSEWDFKLLEIELKEIDFKTDDFKMEDFGFDICRDDEKEKETLDPKFDEVPAEIETKVQYGDVWKLGQHKLYCGDCTKEEELLKLLGEDKNIFVFTDPLYGINFVPNNGKIGNSINRYKKVIGDENINSAESFYKLITRLNSETKMILFGGNYFTKFLPVLDGFNWIVWDKSCIDKKNWKHNYADGEMAWCNFHITLRIYRQLWDGWCTQGEEAGKKRFHPTQKPVLMLSKIIDDFIKDDMIILDAFAGSGSILMAADSIGRTCYSAEIDPRYCDVIIARWENATGEIALK